MPPKSVHNQQLVYITGLLSVEQQRRNLLVIRCSSRDMGHHMQQQRHVSTDICSCHYRGAMKCCMSRCKWDPGTAYLSLESLICKFAQGVAIWWLQARLNLSQICLQLLVVWTSSQCLYTQKTSLSCTLLPPACVPVTDCCFRFLKSKTRYTKWQSLQYCFAITVGRMPSNMFSAHC